MLLYLFVGCLAVYVSEGSEVGIKVIYFRCNNPRDKPWTCELLMCDRHVSGVARETTGLCVSVWVEMFAGGNDIGTLCPVMLKTPSVKASGLFVLPQIY